MSEMKLDTYTYGAMKGADYRTGKTGIEWIARCIVPGCTSQHDAFSVWPEGKGTGAWAGYGAWMCRKCWDSSEVITVKYGSEKGTQRKRGWGNIIDLVMAVEGMTYPEAKRFVLEYEGVIIPMASRPVLIPPKSDEVWMRETLQYLERAQSVQPDDDQLCRDYLASRGITVATAKLLGYGFSRDKMKIGDEWRTIPFLVIPWYKDKAANTLYRHIDRRNLNTPRPYDEEKYYARGGSDNSTLYNGECLLKSPRPTVLGESALDVATALQEAGDLVHVVGTGTAKGGRNAVNEARLRRQPFVFLAFDADDAGEEAYGHWKSKLDPAKCIRWRPLRHDINEMHTADSTAVRQWIEDALTHMAELLPAVDPPIEEPSAQSDERQVDEDPTIAPPQYRPKSLPALPRKACPHHVLTERKDRSMVGAPCKGKPLDHGWCEVHKLSHDFLCLGATLGYPRVNIPLYDDRGRVIFDMAIGEGVVGWEAYAEIAPEKWLVREIAFIRNQYQ